MSELSGTRAADRYIGRDDQGEAERLEDQRAGGSDELQGALALCQLPAQPRVLEFGCGAGTFTRELAAALPGASITAIDLSEGLLAEARSRLDPLVASGRVRLERADAAKLPYAARSFDLVACRFVLMHQADPTTVAAEMHRVADLGGYALAIEPDWGARALYPDADALTALLDLARRAHPYGFPDLTMGRKLFAVLRAAGFVPVQVRATAFVATADDLARPVDSPSGDSVPPGAVPSQLLEQGRPLLRKAGVAHESDVDALLARLAAIPRSQDYCSAGLDFAAVGQKSGFTLPA